MKFRGEIRPAVYNGHRLGFYVAVFNDDEIAIIRAALSTYTNDNGQPLVLRAAAGRVIEQINKASGENPEEVFEYGIERR